MTYEQIQMIERAVDNCAHGIGIAYSICDINGCECGENINSGKCPTLSKLFGEEQEHD